MLRNFSKIAERSVCVAERSSVKIVMARVLNKKVSSRDVGVDETSAEGLDRCTSSELKINQRVFGPDLLPIKTIS